LPGYSPTLAGHPNQIRRAAKLIEEAERPVVLAGHGIILSHAYEELAELVETAQLPVVTSLLGIGSFPENHVLSVGMPGMHGVAYASLALDEADLIIALGSRFDDRITGDAKRFATRSKKIHVDVDPSEIGKTIPVDVPIVGDVKKVLQQLNKRIKPASRPEWIQRIDELKHEHPSLGLRQTDKLIAQYVIQQLSLATEGKAIIVTGVGQHQMWAALHYTFTEPCSLISSGGSGTMGFEVPGAMGAQVGRPDKLVWSIAGDGGFQMTMSELATMAENNIPVKIAIMNNGVLGMVRQWQDMFYEQSFVATTRTGNPDFVKLAEAFGIFGARVTDKTQVMPAIQQAMDYPGPALIDFVVNHEENVYPMIPSGMAVDALIEEPATKPQEVR
jgi:acetolactate synthase-1/2/3 large subunit